MPNPLLERMELDRYGDPEFEPDPPDLTPDHEGEDGVILEDNFYPFYVEGHRNPALQWVLHTANGKATWAVVPELRHG